MADAPGLVAELLATLESAATLAERAAAGRELAAIGDPRALASDRVRIPEGPFEHRRSGGRSTTVHLSEYSIDRYPVTVAAFAEFIHAGGYRSRRYWSDAGWAWRTAGGIKAPRFWGEDEWAAYLVPNHPVVGVSAWEAEAYAAFRDARLPTEAEWEKACCGVEGRCHPWGEAWIDDACAVRGLVRGTLPIGVFPKGASPYGVRDMVGCVWQWCRDAADDRAAIGAEHDDDPQRHGDRAGRGDGVGRSTTSELQRDPFIDPDDYAEGTPRVTRGGGWNNLPWNLHCTSRNGYPPDSRFSNLGLRTVAS